ncbi:MAG: copper resistance protein NlpE N-terminal domain-containing protein [Elusimicrobium sp.]|jgi:hypothetical protein|nr:copper resistance protein NlpE N-terminal domain-containing protein [Elusimicrobium sp.]
MKKLVLVAAIASLMAGLTACANKQVNMPAEQDIKITDDGHGSQNSLDWGGTYAGIVRGDNSQDMKVEIILNYDGTFILTYNANGAVISRAGKFKWSGDNIILDGNDIARNYQVGENKLIQLDSQGKSLADKYVLRQTAFQ